MENEQPGPLTQVARCLAIQFASLAAFYSLMAYRWTLDSPHQLGYRFVTNALQWHAAALEVWIRRSDLTGAQWWHAVTHIYAHDFHSTTWYLGIGLCAAAAVTIALLYDNLAFGRGSSSGESMTRKYITRGLGICFLIAFGFIGLSELFGPHSWLGSNCQGLGMALFLFALGIGTPLVLILRRFLKPARPGEGMTDVREIAKRLKPSKPFDPTQYYDLGRGLFLGRDADKNKPVYLPWDQFRTTHTQILGSTGTGKGVFSQLAGDQAVRVGHTMIYIDPKDDSIAPGVAKRFAREAGVPFYFVDLLPANDLFPHPQINPFQGCTRDDAFELLVAAFNIHEQENNADIYKVEERLLAGQIADMALNGGLISMPLIMQKYEGRIAEAATNSKVKGRRLLMGLSQLWSLWSIQTTQKGPDLAKCIEEPCVLYISGSMTEPRAIMAQKMILFRLMQLIAKRNKASNHQVTLMLDELKYILSPQVLTMLSTVRDRKCNLMLAHQSLGDLADCGTLDAKAVYGAVVENTGIKIAYKTNSPETARWLSELSGAIQSYTATERMRGGFGQNPGSWSEGRRNLIEENVLLNLPKGMAMVYGLPVARLVNVAPVLAEAGPVRTFQFPYEEPALSAGKPRPTTGLPKLVEAVDDSSASQPEPVPTPEDDLI